MSKTNFRAISLNCHYPRLITHPLTNHVEFVGFVLSLVAVFLFATLAILPKFEEPESNTESHVYIIVTTIRDSRGVLLPPP